MQILTVVNKQFIPLMGSPHEMRGRAGRVRRVRLRQDCWAKTLITINTTTH